MGFTLAIGQGIAKKTRNQEEILDGSFPCEFNDLL